MAARRALDRAALKLSLEAWRSLPLTTRRHLIELGSADHPDVAEITRLAQLATPVPSPLDSPSEEPDSEQAPRHASEAFAKQGSLPDKLWQSLSALDRYTLCKVAERALLRDATEKTARLERVWAEIVGHSATSTHVSPGGGVRMIDVGAKQATKRRAVALSEVRMNAEAFGRLQRADAPKGDVLGTARVAGIMAAKKTSELIPLCHPLALTKIEIQLELSASEPRVLIEAAVETTDRTGVEMEAMVAANTAALTVYDMLKAFDRAMQIGPTRLLEKTGGRSGDYQAEEPKQARGWHTTLTRAEALHSEERLCDVREAELSVDEVLAAVKRPEAGAVALFIGDVRDHNAGQDVTLLEYEAYVSMAIAEMRRIVSELEAEIPGTRLAAVHRIGKLAVGDTAILCAASSPHRAEAFQAGRELIDRIKERVPVWKREHGKQGPYWVGWEDARVPPPERR